jgi:NAD(P)-dependent dehydrogenase (short-subunit alcohol dehydrogenase family)
VRAADVDEAIESAGGRAVALPADMGVVEDVRRLVNRTMELFGRLDILVNNAGVGNRTAMADMTEKEFDWTLAVNARGPFFAIQAAVPRMSDGGHHQYFIVQHAYSAGDRTAGGVSNVERRARTTGAMLHEKLGARDQINPARGLCGNRIGE